MMMYCYSTDLNVYTWVELTYPNRQVSEFSSLRNPYYHDKDRPLLKAGLASETPTGNGINPIGDTICIGTYRLDKYICV